MARVLKAKYYPHEDSFLSAKSQPNASFVWKSIMASQEVIRKGTRRQIGNGMSASIWCSPWLLHPTNLFVEASNPDDTALQKVGQLIDRNTGDWNMQKASEVLTVRDMELMLKLVISPTYPDAWFWKDDLRSLYSVKGAYRLLCCELLNDANAGFTRWN